VSEDQLEKSVIIELQRQVADLKDKCLIHVVPSIILQSLDAMEKTLNKESAKSHEEMSLTAQVSIYPLRQPFLSPVINKVLDIFNKHGLEIKPGSMSTLIAGHEAKLWEALRNAFYVGAEQGETVMIVTVSNACPWPPPDYR
jgi:uncharacterized protein YqgV (UPF0045/DUF77 family)